MLLSTRKTFNLPLLFLIYSILVEDPSRSAPNKTKAAAKEKTTGDAKKLVAAADVGKLIDEIINKTCASVLIEVITKLFIISSVAHVGWLDYDSDAWNKKK